MIYLINTLEKELAYIRRFLTKITEQIVSKIREILEKHVDALEVSNGQVTMTTEKTMIHKDDFDKLEKELLKYVDRKVLEAIVELAYSEEGLNIEIKHKETK